MAFTAGFSVNVGDPTKASDVDVLAANDDYLKNAIDTFIANDANNRVLTATGSGTANAETNLTFDGSTLTVTGTVSATTLSGNVTGGTISGTTGTFSGAVTVNDTIRLDTGDTTVSDGDVFGDVEFYDNDGGSASAGVTARIQAVATGNYGASDILFSTSSSSGGARTALTERVKIASDGATTVGSAGTTADFAVWTDGTSSTAAGFTVDASADEVIVGQLSGGGNTTFKVRNRLNNTVFSVLPDAPSTTVFAPNIATGSAGTLTVKTGSINSDSIRLEAGGTTSTWLESRGYLGHSWYVDSTRSMTLDSTGLGVGTDSAGEKLTVVGGGSTTSTANFTGGAAANDNATLASDYSMYYQIDANNTVGSRRYEWRVGGKGYSDGSALMSLTSAGMLGLGTSSPTTFAGYTTLHHKNASGDVVQLAENDNGVIHQIIASGTDTVLIGSRSNHNLKIGTNDTTRLTIDTSGNMGLGVTPTSGWSGRTALEIEGASTGYVTSPNGPIAIGSNIYYNGGDKFVGNGYAPLYALSSGNHIWYTSNNNTSGAGAAVTLTQAMTLTNAGLLGLGTASPQAMLDTTGLIRSTAVTGIPSTGTGAEFFLDSGVAYFQGYNRTGSAFVETRLRGNPIVLDGGSVGIGTSSPTHTLSLSTTGTDGIKLGVDSQTYYHIVRPNGDGLYIGADDGNTGGSGADIRFNVKGTERMRITSAGLCGIGTTSPSYKIHTVGAAGTASALVLEESTSGVARKARLQQNSGATVLAADGTSNSLIFETAGSERARITSAGNLGLGTAAPSSNAAIHAVTTGYSGASGAIILEDTRTDANPFVQIKNDARQYNLQVAGARSDNFEIYDNGAGAIRLAVTSGGNVGIGSQSPTYKLVVSNGGAAGYEFNVNGLNGGVNTLTYNRSTSAYVDSAHFVDNYYIYSGQTPAERFRVESTGVCAFMTPNINIRFNGTATQSVLTNNDGVEIYTGGYIWAGRQAASLYLNRAGTTGDVAVFYYNSTTSVGSISVTSSATAYNTSSDYRLKENLAPITGAVDRVNALQPRRFNFISDPDTTVDGFVAHEVSFVVPEAITGEKDAVDEDGNPEYQGIDQSKLVPLLTAAIQELTARIEALEAA